MKKRGGRAPEVRPGFIEVGDDTIIGSTQLVADGRRHERFQVLTIRNGKIIDMQGFTSLRQAQRFAKSR